MLKMAGIGDRVTFPPVHGSTGTGEVLKYYSQVSPEYITRIGDLYRDDFETEFHRINSNEREKIP